MFLITATHGEYDDFTATPILVVPDMDTAELVVSEMCNPNGEFRQLVDNKLGYPEGTSQGYFEQLGFSYSEIEFFEIT